MSSALIIGGTGFLGRHTVEEFLGHDYDVTAVSRGKRDPQFVDRSSIDHLVGDRRENEFLVDVARRVEPDVVIDCAAFHPDEVRAATEIFADVEAYIYVSSGGVYRVQEIPKREDETPLHDGPSEQADADSMESYGPRKAEGDRIVAAGAARGVAAMSVRPCVLYGPQSVPCYTGALPETGPAWIELPVNHLLHDYWIERVDRFDRVVVPGDGTAIWHRAYVEDVADALRIVAEHGDPGEAYNVGDQRVCTLEDVIRSIADVLGTSVEIVYASQRELARVGLNPDDFLLYHHPATGYPHVLETCKIQALGWQSTPTEIAMARTVEARIDAIRDRRDPAPNRAAEESLLAEIDS